MPRPLRPVDAPGRLYHVMNRGVRHRPMFELESDFEAMEALLACAVRSGRIDLHAYCLMTNHYHLLVESRDGTISETMQWIQSRYVERFNRTRGRMGALMQGRYLSRAVESGAYLYCGVRYIDLNPVKAGLCAMPWEYKHGSAARHVACGRRPLWLCRRIVHAFLAPHQRLSPNASRLAHYAAAFHPSDASPGELDLVAERLLSRAADEDLLDRLFEQVEQGSASWLARWIDRADGEAAGMPMADPGSIREAAARLHLPTRARRCAEAGLLRDLGGQSYRRVASLLEVSVNAARHRYRNHREGMRDHAAYRAAVMQAAQEAVEACFGPAARRASAIVAAWRMQSAEEGGPGGRNRGERGQTP